MNRVKFNDHALPLPAFNPYACTNVIDSVLGPDKRVYVPSGMPLAYGGPGQRPGVWSHDGKFYDSTGALIVGELERLDPKMNDPLMSITWERDIKLREDVTIADELSSFLLTAFGSPGGLGAGNGIGNGKAWITKDANQITGVSVDLAKNTYPLTPWGIETPYTIMELESAAKAGRPIDETKFQAMRKKLDSDTDEMVYIGDTSLAVTGLVNNSAVANDTNAVKGAQGSTLWALKTQTEILNDINTLIQSVWAATAWAIIPSEIRLPPVQYGLLTATIVSLAGSTSIMKFVQDNNTYTANTGKPLSIKPLKWLIGAGSGNYGSTGFTDRMMAYVNEKEYVRFPKTALLRTPVQFDSIWHKTTYYCRLGVVEPVYEQTLGYLDGI